MFNFYSFKDFLLQKIYYFIIGVLVIIILFLLFDNKKNDCICNDISTIEENNIEESNSLCLVNIDIKGYINNPGLYKLECDSRVIDVINEAGGLKDNADTSVINLGKKVFDEMVIVIYSKEEVNNFTKVISNNSIKEEKCINSSNMRNDACVTKENRIELSVNISSSASNNNLISINNGTLDDLLTLPGIGEAKAQAIIKYRQDNNGFKNIEELKNISGIGDKVFEKIKDFISL